MEMEQFTYKTVNLMPPERRDKTFLLVLSHESTYRKWNSPEKENNVSIFCGII